jgi:hypothetical protein
VQRELTNLGSAVKAGGGQCETLVKGSRRSRSASVGVVSFRPRSPRSIVAAAEPLLDPVHLRQRIEEALADWRGLAAKHVQATRQLLRKLLVARITFTPQPEHGAGVIRFTGNGTLAPLVGLLELPVDQRGFPHVGNTHDHAAQHDVLDAAASCHVQQLLVPRSEDCNRTARPAPVAPETATAP